MHSESYTSSPGEHTPRSTDVKASAAYEKPIAIVGIGCRLPGNISSPSELWDFLVEGRSAQGQLPKSRFNLDAFYNDDDQPATAPGNGGYFLQDDIRNFDNQFFGINNREARFMDPQQRKLLEVVFECLESAGVTLDEISGANVGSYVASFTPDFITMQAKDMENFTQYSQVGMGTTLLANRIGHVFNLKGPSCVIDTACSSSLYALHLARSALLADECDAAIVAGVNLIQSPEMHVAISKAGVISPSSTCHTFDASADGYGRADGVNALFIKRLDDALAHGDPIRAVIRSTAVNSNGRTPGITQPSVEGQETVIRKAYSRVGLDPSATLYVEAHGTGTRLGDPVEAQAISNVFRKHNGQSILIGSNKTNLGHAEAASGLTSVIKATLSLENRQIPATVGITKLNPSIKTAEWGVEVVTSATPFPDNGQEIQRVSVNSFGYGGANAHGILDSAPPNSNKTFIRATDELHGTGTSTEQTHRHEKINSTDKLYLLPFSANSLHSLYSRVEDITAARISPASIQDLAYTLGQRRTHLDQRGYIITNASNLARDVNKDNLHLLDHENKGFDNNLAFVFTGQGAQWKAMARELMQFTTFSRTIEDLEEALCSLPHPPHWKFRELLVDIKEDYPIDKAEFAQPLTTAVQIGIVNLLKDWSISCKKTIGHSSGEIAAAYAANLLSARKAITIAYYRGIIANHLKAIGSMAAVGLGRDAMNAFINENGFLNKVNVACINSPESVTISGDFDSVKAVFTLLRAQGIFVRQLETDNKAYHSHHMASVGDYYEQLLHNSDKSEGDSESSHSVNQVTMISTVTCQEVSKAQIQLPSYWRTNLESPVYFSDGIKTLHKKDTSITFIEIGPHSSLKLPIRQTLGQDTQYLASLYRGKDSSASLLNLAGELYIRGLGINFSAINGAYIGCNTKLQFLCDLPTYNWHYETPLWKEPRISYEGKHRAHPRHELLGSEIPGGNATTRGWRNMLQLNKVKWLQDHKLENTVVFPAAGYIAMAIEAMLQILSAEALDSMAVSLRQVDILKVLILAEDEASELHTEMRCLSITNVRASSKWWEFQINSISEGVATVHARGLVCVERHDNENYGSLPLPNAHISSQSTKLWYEAISRRGLEFGPHFQQMHEVFTPQSKGDLYAEARIKSLNAPATSNRSKTRYAVHPVLLDSLFQTGLVACTGGSIEKLAAMVPTRIRHIRIPVIAASTGCGTVRSTSVVDGIHSNLLNAALFDAHGQLVAHFQNANIKLYTGSPMKEERNPISRVQWKPDIDHIHDDLSFKWALDHTMNMESSWSPMLAALDIIVHKYPTARILCVSLDESLVNTILTDVLKATSRYRRFQSFDIGRLNTETVLEVAKIKNFASAFNSEALDFTRALESNSYDLVILKDDLTAIYGLDSYTTNTTRFLCSSVAGNNEQFAISGYSITSYPDSTIDSIQVLEKMAVVSRNMNLVFNTIIHVCGSPMHPTDSSMVHCLSTDFELPVQQITIEDILRENVPAKALVVCTLELEQPVLAEVTERHFAAIKLLMEKSSIIVWVSGSGIHSSFNPSLSLFPGLARAVMVEQPATKLFSLEIDPQIKPSTISHHIFNLMRPRMEQIVDYEYIQEGPCLLVSRIVPDDSMNQHFRQRHEGFAKNTPLHECGTAILTLKNQGQFSSAQFVQQEPHTHIAIPPDAVIVKVSCVGLNAKDIYALAGRLLTKNATCSLEYTGKVVAIGSNVTHLVVGDRVGVVYPGHFGTYETVPSWGCVKLRNDEDYRMIASVLMIFGTAVYALYDRANLKAGETVLIHSAAGGVGLAAIQIAQHIGAKVLATVGTEAKKSYLIEHHGLQPHHIFSSRNLEFASSVRAATGGRGVDVVLNSLAGDALHESWECLADFGRFVEIGKRDLVESGRLNMEKFAQGTTYTAFDFVMPAESNSPAQHDTHRRLLERVMMFLRSGYIRPVQPLSVFGVSDITSAFNYFNSKERMGKVVVSFEDDNQTVPLVAEKFSTALDSTKSYLLVGCLGGLGRSLSIWMFKRGARHFIFLGRSGTTKPAGKRLVEDLEAAGASCTVIRGDVTNYEDVANSIEAATKPLGGVIQAAMGLKEAIFKDMSWEAWRMGTQAKVAGTWNLHNALLKSGKGDALDFFVMTSSINGKVGSATEGNYCAANNFLDVFARYRRSLGLPAISLGIGMVSEVGYLHEHPDIEDLLLRKGIRPIIEEELLQIFDFGITQAPTIAHQEDLLSHPHILTGLELTGLENQRKQGFTGHWHFLDDARFLILASSLERNDSSKVTQDAVSSQSQLVHDMLAMKDQKALALTITELIAKKMSGLVLVPFEKVDIKATLTSFGMDSMLAAELRQYIFSSINVDVELLTLMSDNLCIWDLSNEITIRALKGN